jgi:murein DD-endopeptidase MepM/ murein hydrolase activator NlpD
MAFRPIHNDRRRERYAEIMDLGMDPPIEADGERHTADDRRRVSLRWLTGTILTGLAGTGLIGAAIYAALDRQPNFAEAPVAAGPARREAVTGDLVNPRKSDRLVKPVDIVAGKQTFRTPTAVSIGDREVVRVRGFTRVATNLLLSSAGFSDEVPPFNPLRLLSDARNPVEATPDPVQLQDDAEVAFTTRTLVGVAVPNAGPTLSLDEIEAQVREHLRNLSSASGQRPLALPPQLLLMRTSRASLDPAGGLGYANSGSPILAPFSSIEVRMVAENVTLVPRSPASPTGYHDERLFLVRRGETLDDVLRGAGVLRDQIPRIAAALGARIGRSPVAEGQKIKILFDDLDGTGRIGQVARLSIYSDETLETTVAANDAGAYVTVARTQEAAKPVRRPKPADDEEDEEEDGMRLYDSLYETALKQDIPKPLLTDLVRIFANDVDFQRTVGPGDNFEAFYEENDDPDARNELLYASITTRNETFRYYRFQTPDDGALDYFDENGRSTRKFLVRKPISTGLQRSGFGMRRHPILRYTRMHTGVDWSGPVGTPIFAAGNGTIIKAARESGYGNRVELQHANGYVTTYNHLSGFARGVQEGQRVRQGQVIGFLGRTGLATGPHLHYEVIVNGHFVDPMRVKLARTRELDARMLANFKRERDRIDGLIAKAPNATRVAARQER